MHTLFLQVMVDALMIPSKSANCEEDVDAFLLTLGTQRGTNSRQQQPDTDVNNDLLAETIVPDSMINMLLSVTMEEGDSDHPLEPMTLPDGTEVPEVAAVESVVSSLPQQGVAVSTEDKILAAQQANILGYIGGYIASKLKPKVCSQCVDNLLGTLSSEDDDHKFLSNKLYAEAKVGLVVPSKALLEALKQLESQYCTLVEQVLHLGKLRLRLVSNLSQLPCLSPLACSNCKLHSLVVNLFVNIRLHHTLRLNCRNFVSVKSKKNRKTMKFSHV